MNIGFPLSPQNKHFPILSLALYPGPLTPVLMFVNGVFCVSNRKQEIHIKLNVDIMASNHSWVTDLPTGFDSQYHNGIICMVYWF